MISRQYTTVQSYKTLSCRRQAARYGHSILVSDSFHISSRGGTVISPAGAGGGYGVDCLNETRLDAFQQ